MCIKWLKRALNYLVNQKRIKEDICDEVVQQYKQFVDEVVEGNQSGFSEFNPLTDRVDSLLHELMSKDKRFEKLWRLCRKLLLLLSHGQASVERGFSVNRQIETENMKDETYVARRRINLVPRLFLRGRKDPGRSLSRATQNLDGKLKKHLGRRGRVLRLENYNLCA